MIPVLLILIPLVAGTASFLLKNERTARSWALFASLSTLVVSILGLAVFNKAGDLSFRADWLQPLGSSFSVGLDGMGQVLCLLNAISDRKSTRLNSSHVKISYA